MVFSRQFLIAAASCFSPLSLPANGAASNWKRAPLPGQALASNSLIDSYLEPPLQKLDLIGKFDDGMAAGFDRIFKERQPEAN
jgi:hypothetical protein